MNYSPKHNDMKMRILYGGLVILSFVFMSVGKGPLGAIFKALSILFLAAGLYLFIRHDLTSFSYIVMENGGRLDFYVNRTTGKRGAYVCYYTLDDILCIEDYKKGKKAELSQKHGKVFFYNYCHNRFCGNKQIIVFENQGYCDAVIVELSKECVDYLRSNTNKYEQEN